MGGAGDPLRPSPDGRTVAAPLDAAIGSAERELGVDRVVRMQRRVVQRGAAEVLVGVVMDVEELVLRMRDLEDLLVGWVARARRDPLAEGGRQGERLERGAGLPMPVGRQVEGVGLLVVAA